MTKRTKDFNDFMSDHVNLNPARNERLKSGIRGVSEHLAQNLDGFQEIESQGSHALRTITRLVNDHEYDVDRLLYMDYDPRMKPKDYIDKVYWCMKQNATYADKVRRKKRCVVVEYAGNFHLDIVPCVSIGGREYICNRQTNEFEPTDGAGFRDWFNAKNGITHGNLKRVARLMKYLRDYKQTFTAPSILLTTLIGYAVSDSEDGSEFKTLPDALRTVTNRINRFLQANPYMPKIRNPVLPGEDFARDWDQAKYEHFRKMFNSYTERIERAYIEDDHSASVRQWRDLFGNNFGTMPANVHASRRSSSKPQSRVVTPRKPYAR